MSSTKQDSYIAIVDCNNFYASCERVFNPALNNKPVIVLSNNDGCVIARSQEVKDLGIPMGIPVFKIKHLVEIHDIQIFSSNFAWHLRFFIKVCTKFAFFRQNLVKIWWKNYETRPTMPMVDFQWKITKNSQNLMKNH